MKRILIWKKSVDGVLNAFKANGYEPVNDLIVIPEEDLDKRKILFDKAVGNGLTHAFSFDFEINLARWCYEANIEYISFTVDSPHNSLYSEMVRYKTNRIFVFDHDEYLLLKSQGKEHIYYLPMATDVKGLHKAAVGGINKEKFASDVEFMGNLYVDPVHNHYDQINYLPPYIDGYMDAIMDSQQKIWGMDLFREILSPALRDELKKYIKFDLVNKYDDIFFDVVLDRTVGVKVTQLERKKMCSILAKYYDFKLYTGTDTSFDENIRNCGKVDYLKEMPVLFNTAKININLNMHCISSGIPLRVTDILACEGFCLTNYQPEIAEYFEDGVDLVMYNDIEDMLNKIDYYLEHEEERKLIAHNGYLKVKDDFDYSVRIRQILDVIENERTSDIK